MVNAAFRDADPPMVGVEAGTVAEITRLETRPLPFPFHIGTARNAIHCQEYNIKVAGTQQN